MTSNEKQKSDLSQRGAMKPSEERKLRERPRTPEEEAASARLLDPASAAERQQTRRYRLRLAKVKQVSINLPDDAYQELKRLCTETGQTYSEVLSGMLLGGWAGRPIQPLEQSMVGPTHKLERIDLDLIDPRFVHYEDKDFIDLLADSIHKVGLINPITVKEHTVIKNGKEQARYEVVSGFKRLEAVRLTHSRSIDAFVVKDKPEIMKLQAIAENLHRRELSSEESSKFKAEWDELAEK